MEQNNQKLINELLTKIKKEVNDKINLEPVQTAKTDLVICDLLNNLSSNIDVFKFQSSMSESNNTSPNFILHHFLI